jgi:ferredoxin
MWPAPIKQKGKDAMSVCTSSCIGCGLCEKNCSFDAIHVTNNLAAIDYAKCKGCKICTKVCPRHLITDLTKFALPPRPRRKSARLAKKAAAPEKKAA